MLTLSAHARMVGKDIIENTVCEIAEKQGIWEERGVT